MLKKITLAILIALTFQTAISQQALNQRPQVKSPVIKDGNVELSVYAPEAKSVKVVGDIPGSTVTMQKAENGVWTAVLENLNPEIYIYQFDIDGVKVNDPSNVYTVRDIATVFSMLFVPGQSTDNYAVKDVPHGTVSKVWYESPTLNTKRRLTVYTPAGYETSGKEYPVLYLLHGMGGDEDAWPTLGRTAQIMDNLIAQGLAVPMIVVMPNGNVDLQSAPGENAAGFVVPTTNLPHTMEGSYEESFKDIVDFIDNNYRTKKAKEGRAVAGLSMGGFHSLNISALYPELFDYTGLFSAAINPRTGSEKPLFRERESLLAEMFGQGHKLYWIGIGKDDFLYNENRKYLEYLDSKGYPYVYKETDGGHQWKNWRKYLSEFGTLIFK